MMDGAAITTALTAAGTILGNVWGKLRTAVKAEEAIADQPKLRAEFEAHKDEDQAHHAETRESLVAIHGELRRMNDNVDWIKRDLDQRKEK